MQVKFTFDTITPIFTGDAWGECSDLKSSSLLGSLRFWFEVYFLLEVLKDKNKIQNFLKNYLDSKGIPEEKLDSKKFREKFKENLENFLKGNLNNFNHSSKANFLDALIDKTLKDLELSIPSRIFGCTGWKSRVKIKIVNFSEREIQLRNLVLKISNKKTRTPLNCKWWIEKILFNKKTKIKVFENVEILLETKEYWWKNYLKPFFEYLKNKIILVGGKKSFGFGFVNLKLDNNEREEFSTPESRNSFGNAIFQHRINYKTKKNNLVLGFNFRYYLRKKYIKDKKERELIFGKEGQATRIYISNLDPNKNYLYILVFRKEPFQLNDKDVINVKIIKSYIKVIKSLLNDQFYVRY